jgi:heme oxygenase
MGSNSLHPEEENFSHKQEKIGHLQVIEGCELGGVVVHRWRKIAIALK